MVEPVVVVFQGICLLAEHIDVVEETVVLLLSFDEGCDYLVDIGDTASFFYLLKCSLYDHGILKIEIYESLFLFVLRNELIDSQFHDLNGVGKDLLLLTLRAFINILVETLIIKFDGLILLLQNILKLFEV